MTEVTQEAASEGTWVPSVCMGCYKLLWHPR